MSKKDIGFTIKIQCQKCGHVYGINIPPEFEIRAGKKEDEVRE